jgi:uncharacterized protein
VGLLAGQAVAVALMIASDGDGAVALALVAGDLVLLLCVLVAASRGADRLGAATFGIRRTPWGPALGWSLALLFASFAVEGLIVGIFGMGGSDGGSAVHFAPGTAALIALAIAVTAPIVEETAFRGYLFPALARWRGPWIAAAVTAVLFGAAHVAALPAPMLLGVTFFGFGTCLLFWFTGSLLPGVALHSLNNAIALTVVTGGQLAPAIVAAPVLSLLLLMPLAREHAPDVP